MKKHEWRHGLVWKRGLSILLAVAMLFTSVPMTEWVSAETTEEQSISEQIIDDSAIVQIYFRNTDNWSDVKVYMWDNVDRKLAGEWPGSKVERCGDYYVYEHELLDINEDVNVIFNGSGGQTNNLALPALTYDGSLYKFLITDSQSNSVSDIISPEVHGKEVTLRYQGKAGDEVHVVGLQDDWSASDANKMTGDETGLFTYTTTLEEGTHAYKFLVNGNWTRDPLNHTYSEGGDNNVVRIAKGVLDTTILIPKGDLYSLPKTLDYVDVDGNTLKAKVTYELADPSLAEGEASVKLENNRLLIREDYQNDTLELKATGIDGSAKVIVNVLDIKSPTTSGNSVTFNYWSTTEESVKVTGTMTEWQPVEMTKEGDIYTCTIDGLKTGEYVYKFILSDGTEILDPWNNRLTDKSVFYISGLLNKSVLALKGKEIDLGQVEFLIANGLLYPMDATYELKDSTIQGVTITDGTKLTISADCTAKEIELTATTEEVGSTNCYVKILDAYPEIKGTNVTFYYVGQTTDEVYVVGLKNDWSASETNKMTDKEGNGIFTYTTDLASGKYEYRFIINDKWSDDPLNANKANGNNLIVVPGLFDANVSATKGNETELPASLDYLAADGSTQKAAVTYTLADETLKDTVKIDGNKVTIANECEKEEIILIAKTADGAEAKVTVAVYDKLYTYTIYAYSNNADRMSVEASDLWLWGEDGLLESAAYSFDEMVKLSDGRTWLKTEIEVPAASLGLIFRSKGSWTWQTSNLYYINTDKENHTLYLVDGQNEVYESLADVPGEDEQRYLIVEYTREDGNYDDIQLWFWTSSDGTAYDCEIINDKCIMKAPVPNAESDIQVNFIVRRGEWVEKDGGDNQVTFPADQQIVKVKFANGKLTKTYPYNTGAEIDETDGKVYFYYRDDQLFLADKPEALEGKISVVLKDAQSNEDKEYPMHYDAQNARYQYELPLEAEKDYYYYYSVDQTKVLDAYNPNKITIDGKEYSKLSNKRYELDLTAGIKNPSMDYNDNNVLSVDWTAKEGSNLEGFVVKELYADLTELGLGSKVAIDPELKALSISCEQNVSAGEKTIAVTLKDDCGTTYTAQTKVTVTERVKAEGEFDWDEAVIYFAVTDRFFDGDESNNYLVDKNDETDGSRYHGGDWAGLTEKMDYLAELGINTIWITPIVANIEEDVREKETDGYESYGYHGYWASSFSELNRHLGTSEQLKALIAAAHEKDIKIMVDVVLNHAGYDTEKYFNTIIPGTTMIRNAANTVAGDVKKSSVSGLPDFVTEEEVVRNQLIEWQTAWMENYEIDYYRVDTVKHVEDTTWSAFKNALTESNPDFKLIGEYYGASYTNDGGELGSGTMDSLLDFEFKDYAQYFVLGNLQWAENRLSERNEMLNNTATLGQFLSSHDEDGLLATLTDACNGDEEKAQAFMKVAASLQITAKGQPVIYYGEELGQTGKNDYPKQTNRYDFDWDLLEQQKKETDSFYNHYKKMLNIRKEYSEVFAKGDRASVVVSNVKGYDVIRRSYNGTNIYVALNIKDVANSITFQTTAEAGSTFKDVYSGKTYQVAEDGSVTVSIPKAAEGGTAVLVLTEGVDNGVVDTNKVTVKLHYHRENNDYDDWDVWFWGNKVGGAGYEFVEEDGDMVATITVEGRSEKSVNYIVRKGGSDWKEKDVDKDQSVDISDIVSGTVHFYVESGVAGGVRTLGADVVKGNKVLESLYDAKNNTVTVTMSVPITGSLDNVFTLRSFDGTAIDIVKVEEKDGTYVLTLGADLSDISAMSKSYILCFEDYEYALGMPSVYSSEAFEEAYTYTGNDLGATWAKDSTTFKVWAPTADSVQVALYESGTAGTDDRIKTASMTAGESGVWSVTVEGDLNGVYYTYLVTVNGETKEACDPYARTTGVNGKRAMVLDLSATDPKGWEKDTSPNKGMDYTDAVIYELHVRDASIDESSGVSEAHKGKFLGLTETGTTTANGKSTVLDYIADLGVTHVHLLPVYDYGSVDETKLEEAQFNWGYDPVNYNVPEGSYSTDPYNGEVRVKEMKEMVMALHENKINVVMDVVYNHVYDADNFCFNQIVPQYFSRTNADGSYTSASGCGNDTASERSMVRKYIVDSVLYWAEEYHIDGFRFDLVGLIDTETMNAVIDAVHEKYPDIIFYGEGWDMAGDTATKENVTMSTQKNAALTPQLAYFSDTIRNLLAGDNSANNPGYVSGLKEKEKELIACFTANTAWCPAPVSTVNYASCHDNYTLMDKLNKSRADASEEDRIKMNNLTASIYMLSEGIPFIHAGEEFLRNKIDENGEVIHNSYNSSDYVNALRWDRLEDEKYADVVDYYKGLIAFRKNHEALRLTTGEEVKNNVTDYKVTDNVVLFSINGKDSVEGEVSDGIVVIFNPTTEEQEINLYDYSTIEEGEWKVCINGEEAGTDVLAMITDGKVTVDAISAMVLVKGETVDEDSVYWDNYQKPGTPGEEDDTNKPGTDVGDDTNKPGADAGDDTNKPGADAGDDANKPGADAGDDANKPGTDEGDSTGKPDTDNGWVPSLPTISSKPENTTTPSKPGSSLKLPEKETVVEQPKAIEVVLPSDATAEEQTELLVKAITQVKEGQDVVVKVADTESGTAVISVKVFEMLEKNKEKDANLVIELPNGFSWTINANSIKTEDGFADLESIDFWAGTVENVIPSELVSSVADEKQKTIEISIKHNGSFGLTAALDIPVDRSFAGQKAVLYYFNTETNAMEKIGTEEIGEDGNVRFLFTHASDYLLVIEEAADENVDLSVEETEKVEDTEMSAAAEIESTGGSVLPVVVILCILLCAAAVAVTLQKKKSNTK